MSLNTTKRFFTELVLENGDTVEVSLIRNKIDIQVYHRNHKGESILVFDTKFTKEETQELIKILQEMLHDSNEDTV